MCMRFVIAAIATTGLAVGVDQYQEYRLSLAQAVNLRSLPSVHLPGPQQENQRIQSRIVWIDDNTFLHFLSYRTYGDTESAEQITLTRYRYTMVAGLPTPQKLTEHKWPFGSEYSFTDEIASEVHLSPDKQKVMIPIARKGTVPGERDHYLGVVRLHPEPGESSETVWKIDPTNTGGGTPRLFWLPDSQHIAAFFDRTAIDLFDINSPVPARRIALDPMTDPKIRERYFADAAQIDFRGTEAVGISWTGELALLSRMPHPKSAPPFVHLCFETIPLSSAGVDANALGTHFVPSDINPGEMDEMDLSPDGRWLLYRAFLPASRSTQKGIHETRWQDFRPRNFTWQFAALDLQTGKSTPLFQAEMGWGTVHRLGAINGINLGAQWLPSSQHISVSAESPGRPDNHLMWRLPVTH